jgi:hypothetical protein
MLTLRFPDTSVPDDAEQRFASRGQAWVCAAESAAITWRDGVQVFTVRVRKLALAKEVP